MKKKLLKNISIRVQMRFSLSDKIKPKNIT